MLKVLNIKNFKCYQESTLVEFKKFTAIIGPNGVGKSTILDALAFVFNLPKYDTKFDLLESAICTIEKRTKCSSVEAIIWQEDGSKLIFKRLIDYKKRIIQFLVDGVEVTHKDYQRHMERLNIIRGMNNCLLFQNEIENIALMSQDELRTFFEDISGSVIYKPEYERLSGELTAIQMKVMKHANDKANLSKQLKSLKGKMKETHQYIHQEESLKKLVTEWRNLQLFNIKRKIDISIRELEDKRKTLNIDKIEENNARKKCSKLEKEIEDLEQKICSLENENGIQTIQIVDAKESRALYLKQEETARKNLEKALQAVKENEKNIEDLHSVLNQLKNQRDELEDSSAGTPPDRLSQQVQEYNELQLEFAKRSHALQYQYDNLQRGLELIQDKLDFRKSVMEGKRETMKKKKQVLEELRQKEIQIEKFLEKTKVELEQLQSQFNKALEEQTQAEKMLQELNNLNKEMQELNLSIKQRERLNEKLEIFKELKAKEAGVVNRLYCLCEFDEKFQISFEKILSKDWEAIVVDSEKTARNCIEYLRTKRLGRETFIPLQGTSAKSRKEILKEYEYQSNPPSYESAYDIIERSNCNPNIKQLLQLRVGKIFICDTDETARKLAYSGAKRMDCISLNGTYFRKSGVISGGTTSLLERRELRSQTEEYAKLKEQKAQLQNNYQELRSKVMKADLEVKKLEIQYKKDQLQHFNCTLKETKGALEQTAAEYDHIIGEDILHFSKELEEFKKSQMVLDVKKVKLEKELSSIEEEVFHCFCIKYGLKNIHEFQGDFKDFKAKKSQIEKINAQISQVENQINFDQHRDTITNVRRWEKKLDVAKENVRKINSQLNESKLVHNQKKKLIEDLKKNKEDMEQRLKTIEKKIALEKEKHLIKAQIKNIEKNIENLKLEKHNLLIQFKVTGVEVPQNTSLSKESNESTCDDLSEEDLEYSFDELFIEDSKKNMNEDELEAHIEKLRSEIESLRSSLTKIHVDNKISSKIDSIQKSLKRATTDLSQAKENSKKKLEEYESCKKFRRDKFNEVFIEVSKSLDSVYKELYNSEEAQAFLIAENSDEPYLGVIRFDCLVPGKRYATIEHFSGGEKALAAMALRLSLHKVKPTPFLILDEVDAALDKDNCQKLMRYLGCLKVSKPIIIITHKPEFSRFCNAIIGITQEYSRPISKVIHLALKQWQEKPVEKRNDSI